MKNIDTTVAQGETVRKSRKGKTLSLSNWVSVSTNKMIKKRGFVSRNKWLFWTCFIFSFLFAVISFSSGFYWVYDMISTMNRSDKGAWLIAFVVLLGLEQFDRKSTSEVAEDWYWGKTISVPWAMISIIIFFGSLYLSVDGTNEGGESLMASSEVVVTDSLLSAYVDERALVRKEIKDLENKSLVKENGIMVIDYGVRNGTILKEKNNRVTELNKLIDSGNNDLKGKRKLLTNNYQSDVKKYTYAGMFLVGIAALLRHACIFFCWFYRWKQWIEDKKIEFIQSKNGKVSENDWNYFWDVMDSPIDTPEAISFQRAATFRQTKQKYHEGNLN